MIDIVGRSVIESGSKAYIGFEAGRGAPFLSPVKYAPWKYGIGFFSAASTRKARMLGGVPAGVLIRSSAGTLAARGQTTTVNVTRSSDWRAADRWFGDAWQVTHRWIRRNAADLAGFARDAGSRRIPTALIDWRVLVLISFTEYELYGGPDCRGGWSDRRTLSPGEDVVIALGAKEPQLFPGHCRPGALEVRVPHATASFAGVCTTVAATLVTDRSLGPGPASKSGIQARGTGRVEERRGDCWVDVRPSTWSFWDGGRRGTFDCDGMMDSGSSAVDEGDS